MATNNNKGLNKIEKSMIDPDFVGEVDQLNQQLAETSSEVMRVEGKLNTEVVARAKERKPMMTFIDDDGRREFLEKWEPIIAEKQIPVTVAIVTSWVENKESTVMQWEDIHRLKNTYGLEFVSHTHTHEHANQLTEAQIHQEFKPAKQILMREGLTHDIIVQPYGENTAGVRKVSRQYARANVGTREGINYPPLETFRINRVTLAEETNNSLDYYKSIVDEAVDNNGWIVWKSHSQYASFDATQIQHIRDIIDYARSKGVDIVTVSEGLDRVGNVMDVGDYVSRNDAGNEGYMLIDYAGNIHSKEGTNFYFRPFNTSKIDTPVSAYPEKSQTVEYISGSNSTSFPEGLTGTLVTTRAEVTASAYQVYYMRSNDRVYKRRWNDATSSWTAFENIINPILVTSTINQYSSDSTRADFPTGKIIFTQITSAHPGIAKFPEGQAGTLITNTLYDSAGYGYSYQEYHTYNGKMFRRRLHNNPAWVEVGAGSTAPAPTETPGTVLRATNAFTASTPITDYPNAKVTHYAVNNSGASGFPDNTAGVVTVYRYWGNGWDRMEYRKYRSNEVWARYVETDGTWSAWEKISATSAGV